MNAKTRAQTAPAQRAPTVEQPKVPVPGQILVQEESTILGKDLIGQTVYAPDKVKIGSISDLVLSKDAKTIEGFLIGVWFSRPWRKERSFEARSSPNFARS